MQTHVSENKGEVAWVKELFPERKGYLDVYDHYSLCRPRAVFGHGIHLTDDEMQVMHRTGSAIAHCPTSNFFLGSGFFNIQRAMQKERPVRVGLGTDLGAGTSFSILATLNEAYKAAQLNSYALSAGHAYYVATRGTAHAMYLDDKIGSIAPGMEADLVVLDMKSTPIIEYRMQYAQGFRRGAVHPDDARRRPRGAGHLRGRRAALQPRPERATRCRLGHSERQHVLASTTLREACHGKYRLGATINVCVGIASGKRATHGGYGRSR